MQTIKLFCYLAFFSLLLGCSRGGFPADGESIQASGFIEGRTYSIASAFGGRVMQVLNRRGDPVSEGQIVVRLDTSPLARTHEIGFANLNAAETSLLELQEKPNSTELAAAEAEVALAEAELEKSLAELALLFESYRPLKPPKAEVHAFESAVEIARAGADLARARLDQVKAGPSDGELKIAQAKVAEAKAYLLMVDLQWEEFLLKVPVNGIVSQVLVEEGELAAPGAPIMTVLDPEYLTLTLYVPETRVAKIDLGDPVQVTVDAYPDAIFTGTVHRIADRAHFTPTEAQTQQERVKLVFAVEILLGGPIGRLKAGMPADAIILP